MPKLTAKECRKFIDAVLEKATAMGAPVSVAVVGPEGFAPYPPWPAAGSTPAGCATH